MTPRLSKNTTCTTGKYCPCPQTTRERPLVMEGARKYQRVSFRCRLRLEKLASYGCQSREPVPEPSCWSHPRCIRARVVEWAHLVWEWGRPFHLPPMYVHVGGREDAEKLWPWLTPESFVCFKHTDLLMLKCQTILDGNEGVSCHLKMTIEVVSLISDFIQW